MRNAWHHRRRTHTLPRHRSRLIAATGALVVLAAACAALPNNEPLSEEEPSAASTPFDRVVDRLRAIAPEEENVGFDISTDNELDDDWLQFSPDCWGQERCQNPTGIAALEDTIERHVAASHSSVDILTLNPLPTGRFRAALIRGLRSAIHRGSGVEVRVLAGNYPLGTSLAQPFGDFRLETVAQWGRAVEREVGAPSGRLTMTVARLSTNQLVSWNHAKALVVDRTWALVGGHNMWSGSYLQTTDPVHDVSMSVTGGAAASAARFADTLWQHGCRRRGSAATNEWWTNVPDQLCLSNVGPAPTPAAGTTRILSVARFGLGIRADPDWRGAIDHDRPEACSAFPDFTNLGGAVYDRQNLGEEAVRSLIRNARERVFIAQQDLLAFCPLPSYDRRLFDAIAGRLLAGVDVTIVVSNPGATGASGTPYSNLGSMGQLVEPLWRSVVERAGDAEVARTAFCARLRLAPLRFGPAEAWPNGRRFGLHAKVVAVDESTFTIGSGNAYPAWLQEFGYVVDDPAAASELWSDVLEPMWSWSSRAAVVDPATSVCPR